jgi:hypothetical protein
MVAVATMIFAGCNSKNEPADADEQVDGNDDQAGGYVAVPPHAASSKTWKFGNQTWSDVIQIPECNKETFEASYTTPQCYCNSGYLYNWVYVNTNAYTLCPNPWRVPSDSDLRALIATVPYQELVEHWSLRWDSYDVQNLPWSNTRLPGTINAWALFLYSRPSVHYEILPCPINLFSTVRCVR